MYKIKCCMTTILLISQIYYYETDMNKLDSSKYALITPWPGCNRRGWEYFSSQVLPQFSTVGIKTNVEKISWRCVTFQRCFVEEHCGENNDGFIEKDTLSISRMKQELSFMLHHSIVILLSRLARYPFPFVFI